MATLVTTTEVDRHGLAALMQPRDGLVAEAPADDGSFVAADGPMKRYRRTVTTERPSMDGAPCRVTERIDFELAIPLWWPLFVLPVKALLRSEHKKVLANGATSSVTGAAAVPTSPRALPIQPFWAPPDRFTSRASRVLALVCATSLVTGYVGTIITQTITYSATEFHRSTSAQGVTLAGVRVGVLFALVAAAAADRHGRRRLLLLTLYGSCISAAIGALSPDLVMIGITQAIAGGLSTAAFLLITIVIAEEVPAGSRAWAVGLLTMSNALGAGICVIVLPLADIGVTWWRSLYVIAVLGIPLIAWAARQLPESRRFLAHRASATVVNKPAGASRAGGVELRGVRRQNSRDAMLRRLPHGVAHRRRFWVLAVGLFGVAIFAAPATQLLNDFLRHERSFSAAHISAFTILTNTPAGIGILIGGWLADMRGRRLVAAIGVAGGTVLTVFEFYTHGWPMWWWSLSSSMLAALAVPAFGVYGPELFPTSLRGRIGGLLSVVTVVGSGIGLVLAGVLKDSFGHLGPAMAVLSIAPLLVAALVLIAYPETAGWELEDLNPEDRSTTAPASPLPP